MKLGSLAIMLLLVPSVAIPAAPSGSRSANLRRVAEPKSVDIRLDAGHRSIEIRAADATFIKVHFERFSLPDGVTLEVASPDGMQVYRYGRTKLDAHTVSKELLGQDGATSFSAMSVLGPVVSLRIVGWAGESWLPGQGVEVKRYLEGYSEERLAERHQMGRGGGAGTNEICMADNKRPVACFASDDSVAFDRSRPVARMLLIDGFTCTAWRVGPDNLLFTNNHCADEADEIAGAEFWFDYQAPACEHIGPVAPVRVAGDILLKTSPGLDYTLFTVKDFGAIAEFGYLGLDVAEPVLGTEIFIAGHPGGRRKELSVVSDKPEGRCRIDSFYRREPVYSCDTEVGNSGSPVIARENHRALVLHNKGRAFGECSNSGTPISSIWPEVSTYFGGKIPVGDDEAK